MWPGVSPVTAQMWQGRAPVQAQTWQGRAPVPAQMWLTFKFQRSAKTVFADFKLGVTVLRLPRSTLTLFLRRDAHPIV
jgi:hypothetical protein